MKKNVLIGLVSFAAIGGFSNVANASDGTINFTGEIIDQTCTIDSASKNLTVDLGRVAKSSLDGATGKTSSPTAFQLRLIDCPSTVTAAAVKFDGTADSNNNTLLKLTNETGVATGVGIQIADKNGAAIPLYTASMDYPLVAGDNALDFVARYMSTMAAVTTGPAKGVTQFTLNYK